LQQQQQQQQQKQITWVGSTMPLGNELLDVLGQ
jgi:hypothetical protein